MKAKLPLQSLLSFALVAFTVEFDNAAEQRIPHRTSCQTAAARKQGTPAGHLGQKPWLVSLAMYWRFLRFVPDEGIAPGELRRAAGLTPEQLRTFGTRMGKWWGYLRLQDGRVRLTPGGQIAVAAWQPLMNEIEDRWQERFGPEPVGELREALDRLSAQMPPELPDAMPVLGYGLFTADAPLVRQWTAPGAEGEEHWRPLPALLARLLVAFAAEYEAAPSPSLAVSANVLRVIEDEVTRVRDLPQLSGISKEGLAMALGWLAKQGYARVEAQTRGSRVQMVRLMRQGILAQQLYRRQTREIERQWGMRYGEEHLHRLRRALERIAGDGTRTGSPLWSGLEPPATGWRSKERQPETLPHFPMVLHRGGYPDGS